MAAIFKPKKDIVEFENKSVRLPKPLIDDIQKLADENEMSFNRVVIQCIEFALEHQEREEENKKNGEKM